MSRYINADELYERMQDICAYYEEGREVKEEALLTVYHFHTADVEEVKHGEWVIITAPRHDPHGEKFWLCTNCERAWRKELLVDVAFGDFPKRCPECGAHMSRKEKRNEVSLCSKK